MKEGSVLYSPSDVYKSYAYSKRDVFLKNCSNVKQQFCVTTVPVKCNVLGGDGISARSASIPTSESRGSAGNLETEYLMR
jgi:hypothetical protein